MLTFTSMCLQLEEVPRLYVREPRLQGRARCATLTLKPQPVQHNVRLYTDMFPPLIVFSEVNARRFVLVAADHPIVSAISENGT